MQTTRRDILKGALAASAALYVGFDAKGALATSHDHQATSFNPFVAINQDGSVTVIVKHFEMGQGTSTGLPTLIAEELDADWDTLQIVFAPADNSRYANLLFGAQGTGGSTAMANSYKQYRMAGAAARALLIEAAAAHWHVNEKTISIKDGQLIAKDGRHMHFGTVAAKAAQMPPPLTLTLKDKSAFRYIGNPHLPRKDNHAKTNGTAIFALDVTAPDMLYAVIKRSPRFGGVLTSFSAAEAGTVPGFVDAKAMPNKAGIAVYARDSWAAIKARDAINAEWDFSNAENRDTSTMIDDYRSLLDNPTYAARPDYDTNIVAAMIDQAPRSVEAEFSFPFLAHAPMEPLNCMIEPSDTGVTVHDGCQFPALAQPTIAAILGLKPEQVDIHTVYAGGSFGRRANPTSDYHAEAAMAFALIGQSRPVKLFWTREDDIRGGYYRPMALHRARIGLDHRGALIGWDHRIVSQSIFKGTAFESAVVLNGLDHSSVEGIADTPYNIPNLSVGLSDAQTPIPALWWRSVGHSHSAYAMEVLIDMAAEAANIDPIQFRLNLLSHNNNDSRRLTAVLKHVAKVANWGHPLPANRKRGVALHKSFNSYVAQIAEVTQNPDQSLHIERMICAVDCGVAVNPDIIAAQMQGGIGYALGAVMRNQITLTKGVVDQSNFPDYEPLRIHDMPHVEVHIIPSSENPTGVGEPGTPPAGAALANAIYALTGTRPTKLPLTASGLVFA